MAWPPRHQDREAAEYVEEAPADRFPFRPVEMARQLTVPVVPVLGNVHTVGGRAIVAVLRC